MSDKLFSVQAGYIPLNDAAILIIAKEKGFAAEEGIDLKLHKETSWATLRDKLAIGLFDVAHLLAPMPVADACNLFPLPLDIVVPMALGLGGNMITISRAIWELHLGEADQGSFDPVRAGSQIRRILHQRRDQNLPLLKIGVVHPYSAHNYELRYWLAGCGINPDRDVDIVFLPPSMMPAALEAASIDAYCVGEPWNSVAIRNSFGLLVTTKSHIWRSSPEKVLGVRRSFCEEQTDAYDALLRALHKAAVWIDRQENISETCQILSHPNYIGIPEIQLHPGFSGRIQTGFGTPSHLDLPDFYISSDRAANFPWPSHALWFYSQMIRWHHATWSPETAHLVCQSYQPDHLRRALAPLGVSLPMENQKIEGACSRPTAIATNSGELTIGPDGFFDERLFDPRQIEQYLKTLSD